MTLRHILDWDLSGAFHWLKLGVGIYVGFVVLTLIACIVTGIWIARLK